MERWRRGESHIRMGGGEDDHHLGVRNRCCLPIILQVQPASVPVRAQGVGRGSGGP